MPKKSSKKATTSNSKGAKKSSSSSSSKKRVEVDGEVLRVARTHGFIREVGSLQEYFVSGRELLGAVPGDIVSLEKIPPTRERNVNEGEKLPEGRVVKILRERDGVMTGTIVPDPEREGYVALSPDTFGSRFPLMIGKYNGDTLMYGDKVSFILSHRGEKHHLHIADITGVYGSSKSARVCVTAYLEEKGISPDFPDKVLAEARDCGTEPDPAEVAERVDLRGVPIFTIDGADTKDIDDAINIERTESGYTLGVHIADVSHYVTPKTALDAEAFERGTSVYVADLVVPMLPKALSNGICSLNPKVDRLAFSCIMEVGKDGALKSFEFKKTVIRSRVQGVYSEINEIIAGEPPEKFGDKYAEVAEQIPAMLELATTLKKNRAGRYAPALDSPESKIVCDEDGRVVDIIRRQSGEGAISEGIIEEFMLLANNAAARLAMEKKLPFVYRIHEQPAAEKLTRLADTLTALGIPVKELTPTAECLSEVLRKAKEEQPEKFEVLNMAVLRTMMKAKYHDEPLGHFGLVMDEYAHFTSPIRRYPDLSIHRILSDYAAGKKAITRKYGKFAHESSLKSTQNELKAVSAERDCNGFYCAEYMSSRIGEQFDGIVTGVTEMSVFVMLPNTVEGRVSVRVGFARGGDPDNDGYEFSGVALSNAATGERYMLGDKVKVKCISANVPMGQVDFEFVR